VNLDAKQWVHLTMFRKTWTSNTMLWHSIMLENYHMVIFTVNHLFVVKQSFALPFSHMHAKVKLGWWSDLRRALIHCLGCGHFLLLPDILLACHVW
jgi:hypothetical protein